MMAFSPETASSPPDHRAEQHDEACIANISPGERLKRLISGVIPFVIAVGLLGWLTAIHADRWWRLPLFFLFAAAATGFFQWRDKTWVRLASRSLRNLTGAEEKIEDEVELAQVRRQARKVYLESVLAAIAMTVLVLALPR